jgi:hypothetical protein
MNGCIPVLGASVAATDPTGILLLFLDEWLSDCFKEELVLRILSGTPSLSALTAATAFGTIGVTSDPKSPDAQSGAWIWSKSSEKPLPLRRRPTFDLETGFDGDSGSTLAL